MERNGKSLRQHNLENVAGADIVFRLFDHIQKGGFAHICCRFAQLCGGVTDFGMRQWPIQTFDRFIQPVLCILPCCIGIVPFGGADLRHQCDAVL